ncbi:MAG: hypothetical protein Q4E75_01610 [bacterium]|nr:hypothetical protein [bacterium]
MTTLEIFKDMFEEELDDPNEAFMFFLLSLIPEKILKKVVSNGKNIFYDNIEKY